MTRLRNGRSFITLERSPSEAKIAKLLAALAGKPQTKPEIAQLLHVSVATAERYINVLHERGDIHIARWTREPVAGMTGRPRQVYAAGPGNDAKRLPALTKQQINGRHYRNMKQEPARYVAYLAQAKHRSANKRFKPHPDVAAAWVFRKEA